MGPFDFFLRGRRLAKQLTQLDQLSDPLLVDVRTPEEFRSGHLPGAINLPLDQLGAVPLPKAGLSLSTATVGPEAPRPAPRSGPWAARHLISAGLRVTAAPWNKRGVLL